MNDITLTNVVENSINKFNKEYIQAINDKSFLIIFNDMLDHKRDHILSQRGTEILKKYCLSHNHRGECIETPQLMFLRASIALHFPFISEIKRLYDNLSHGRIMIDLFFLRNAGIVTTILPKCDPNVNCTQIDDFFMEKVSIPRDYDRETQSMREYWRKVLRKSENIIMFNGALCEKSNQSIPLYPPTDFTCGIGVINLNSCLSSSHTFDFFELQKLTVFLTNTLTKLLKKYSFYLMNSPTNSVNNVYITVCGLADILTKMGISYGSDEAMKLDKNIFAIIYYFFILTNCGGPYGYDINLFSFELEEKYWLSRVEIKDWEKLKKSPIVQCDNFDYNWEELRHKIIKNGVKSMGGTCVVPLEKIAEILNASVGVEPQKKCINRRTLVDMCVNRGPFISLFQHIFTYAKSPLTYEKLSAINFYCWKSGLKSGTFKIKYLF